MTGKPDYVQYFATRYGYQVTAYDADSQPVDEYRAGNHPGDSQATVTPKSRYTAGETRPVPLARLRKWAKDEALDTAKRLGLTPDRVSYDGDGEADELALRAEMYPNEKVSA